MTGIIVAALVFWCLLFATPLGKVSAVIGLLFMLYSQRTILSDKYSKEA